MTGAATDDEVEGQHANPHTFHLPNVFSRSAGTTGTAYHALPNSDDVNEAPNGEEQEEHQRDGFEGVNELESWQRLSGKRQLLVQLCFGVLGAAILLPFNALITPSEFYRTLLRNTPHSSTFMSWIVVVYNVGSITLGAHATATMQKSSIVRRTYASAIFIIAVLLLVTFLSSWYAYGANPTDRIDVAFPIIVCITASLAAAASYLQVALVTLSNAFGPTCLGTMLAGQGLVGAIVSCIQLLSAYANAAAAAATAVDEVNVLATDHAEAKAAVSFFGATTVFMVCALACFARLRRTDVFMDVQECIAQAKEESERAKAMANSSLGSRRSRRSSTTIQGVRRYMNADIQRLYDRVVNVQRKTIVASFSIAYVFVITLSVFPALTSRVRPVDITSSRSSTLLFVAWHFLAFNVSDLLGRSLPTLAPGVFCTARLKLLSIACIVRTVLVPLLAMCHVAKNDKYPTTTNTSPLFGSFVFFALVIVLGLSNGFLATNIFIAGPRQPTLSTAEERNLTAGLLSWWLTLGLAVGSFVSFFVGNA